MQGRSRSNSRNHSPPRLGEEEEAEHDNNAPNPNSPVLYVSDYLEDVISWTYPSFSFSFLVLFVALTLFHESFSRETLFAIGIWTALQIGSSAVKPDFRNDLFWNIMSLIGRVLLYLFIGHLWSYVKFFINIWQGHASESLLTSLRACEVHTCFTDILLTQKASIAHWTITWPMSMIHTMTRDPLRIVTDLLFHWSQQRMFHLARLAVTLHDNKSSDGYDDATAQLVLIYWIGSVVGYLFIGYLWAHLKLFIDVWRKALPPSVELDLQNRQSYFSFVLKIKWLVTQWILTWPFSVLFTLFQHPLAILAEFIHRVSTRTYAWIVERAFSLRA
jgi:hypothetical protein